MRVELRRLREGELDHELIWLVVSVAGTAAALSWLALHLPWPVCTFRALTGWPCATCGATRSALAFFHGDFGVAWRFNPLIAAAICALVLFDLYAISVLVLRTRRLRLAPMARGQRRAFALLLVGALLLNWIYLLRVG